MEQPARAVQRRPEAEPEPQGIRLNVVAVVAVVAEPLLQIQPVRLAALAALAAVVAVVVDAEQTRVPVALVETAVAVKSAFTVGKIMKSLNIDLGDCGPCSPCCAETKSPDKYYPTVTYYSTEDIELPDEGTLLIKFKKVRSTEETKEERHSCTFEVQKILGVGKSKDEADDEHNAGKAKNGAAAALDALRAKKKSEY